MASTTSQQPHDTTDGIVRPRPVKPGNPMVLRTQGENSNLTNHRANGGPLSKLDMPASGLSRYANPKTHCESFLAESYTAAGPLPSHPTLLPLPYRSLRPGNRYEHSRNIACSLALTMLLDSPISIPRAITAISVDFSSCFGSG